MHVKYASSRNCCGCKCSILNKKNITRVGVSTLERIRRFFTNNSIQIDEVICNKCRTRVNFNRHNLMNSVSAHNNNLNQDTHRTVGSVDINNTQEQVVIEEKSRENNLKSMFNKSVDIPTALATRKHCLFCKQNKGLRKISQKSIIYCYMNHGKFIKPHSVCCDSHLDQNGLIKTDEFINMPTRLQKFDKDSIFMLNICIENLNKVQASLMQSTGIFDKFLNIAELDDDLCKKITGWNKLTFITFADMITRIRDTTGRTKEQLIAIYMYWLRKGLDQSTLALFKNETSQRQISHYLFQIRTAINSEFVPKFLGAKKGKEFFLKHNSKTTQVLHDMDSETLAVVVDGTYTKLEKSSNNNFQYFSYSMHKKHNLIKPFIMCCTDGYFIDCYGPYQARENDATIFRHILETDEDLKILFHPKDKVIIFGDRGILSLNINI